MFKLELTEQMTMIIINALGNHPYKEAAPVIRELQQQINAQMAQRPPTNGQEPKVNDVQHRPNHQ